MSLSLFLQAIAKFFCGIVIIGLLIFWPAGTLAFFNGWLLMGILFIPMFLAGIVMMVKNPSLLQKRLQAKEKQKEQDLVVKLSALMFLIGFVMAGLGYRFHWYSLPRPVVIVAAVVFLIAYGLYAEVLRENTFLSRTIEVQEHQTVVSTGLYGIVRHPMYSITILLFLSMPIVLGSVYSLLIFLVYPFIIAKRIQFEEQLLAEELDGYRAYQQKVRWRLIPFVW